MLKAKLEAYPASHTPAHDFTATVAPFRAWRGLQLIIARGPAGSAIMQAPVLTDGSVRRPVVLMLRILHISTCAVNYLL